MEKESVDTQVHALKGNHLVQVKEPWQNDV